MSLDLKIIDAIRAAVDGEGQPSNLARRLVAWLEAIADESEDINDIAATDRRLEIIYEAVLVDEEDDANETDDNGESES
ncbi:hypothetical protein LCM4577_26750 [Mesorhizobium sp. LCM 4577]|uniref:CxC ATPase DNA modification system associated small protein n=1 Tax=Mesorhizobium sp. LCM 4577 TaxID=1848288 RepID=UPI0008DAAD54|nr:CxC ATPase DNA modification system associated small protein [Mesorhizobium sp. LCM 4577]OHV67155.1 hypothetical protein LCM4577_26750 [Mesorhizobium sp. LCM 4577]